LVNNQPAPFNPAAKEVKPGFHLARGRWNASFTLL
jgi:hypothetical protein